MVLEAESSKICQTGFEEEAEIQYKVDQEAALAPCRVIKHVFERTARDSPDVKFLSLEVHRASTPKLYRSRELPSLRPCKVRCHIALP